MASSKEEGSGTGKDNIFRDQPAALREECFDALWERPGVRIERILSRGQSSPPGFWYDQSAHEWVLLLQGEARLEFADGRPPLDLQAGDYLDLPAGLRHRVAYTSTEPAALWLAVFQEP